MRTELSPSDREALHHAFVEVLAADVVPTLSAQQARFYLRAYLRRPIDVGSDLDLQIAWRERAARLLGQLLVEDGDAAR